MTDGASFGGSGLLRVAGLPLTTWTDGGDPALFALLRELDETEAGYAATAPALADRVGRDLVPHPALSRAERGAALRVRRALHQGTAPGAADAATAATAAARAGLTGLAAAMAGAAATAEAIGSLTEAAAKGVRRAQERSASFPWDAAAGVPAVETVVRAADDALWDAVTARLARGESWSGKRLRHWSERLWRVVGRAAVKSTPRGWFGHVALVAFGAGELPRLDAGCATEWAENVHTQRAAATAATEPGTLLALVPVWWRDQDHAVLWVADPDDPTELREVRLRWTDLLAAVCAAMGRGAVTFDDVVAAVVPGADGVERAALARFAGHLAEIGVVEVSRPARRTFTGWHEPPRAVARTAGDDGYLDVYRRAPAVGADLRDRVEALVTPALRVLATVAAALPVPAGDGPADIGETPRPVLSVVRDRLRAGGRGVAHAHARGWLPATAGTPYHRLVTLVGDRAADGAVDLTTADLDAVGAPRVVPDWPLDVLCRVARPGADHVAVLEQVFPAGTVDARFVAALERLHGAVPHAEAYRAFLRELEERTGVPCVELLAPPMTRYAANAVRRPRYTALWTGDADAARYGRDPGDGSYLPLHALTIRRVGGRLAVEADGRAVWPMYHATRSPLEPWATVAEVLLSAAPRPPRWVSRRLHRSLDLFPDRTHVPRITVDGGLVLACAQWRLRPAALWEPADPLVVKARGLERAGRRLGLPRWVFAAAGGARPVPCDLASVTAVRTLERLGDGGAEVVVSELLPGPGSLLVTDALHDGAEVVSELLLRVPGDVAPTDLAERAAAALGPTNWRQP